MLSISTYCTLKEIKMLCPVALNWLNIRISHYYLLLKWVWWGGCPATLLSRCFCSWQQKWLLNKQASKQITLASQNLPLMKHWYSGTKILTITNPLTPGLQQFRTTPFWEAVQIICQNRQAQKQFLPITHHPYEQLTQLPQLRSWTTPP